MAQIEFPDKFLWGAATSSHQVEGGNRNDWTEWEAAGRVRNNDQSGMAADHWNRYEEDFELLTKLNLNTYRFSIEWSRIEPEEGEYNPDATGRYLDMLTALRERGIEPQVTLHHFTNPIWAPDWSDPRIVDCYLEYVRHIVGAIGPHVTYLCTINEPNILAVMAYQQGAWPPGKANILTYWKALRNMRRAHKKAYKIIHEMYRDNGWETPKVSMAFNLQNYQAASNNPLHKIGAKIATYFADEYTLRRVRKQLDYIGVNYYFSHRIGKNLEQTEPPKNDLGWDMRPQDIKQVLLRLKKYGLPVLITETGQPDAKDAFRGWWIVRELVATHQAMQRGVDVIGYTHWSLLDNFEWQEGFAGRFGLAEVDYETQRRTLRPSAKMYGRIAKDNTLSQEMIEEYS